MQDVHTIWNRIASSRSRVGDFCSIQLKGVEGCVEGSTAFFRHAGAYAHIVDHLAAMDLPHDPHILVAPSSIGCEPYSMAVMAEEAGLIERYPGLRITALDRSDVYTKAARGGVYPHMFWRDIPAEYQGSFLQYTRRGEQWFMVKDHVRERVQILDAQTLEAHKPERPYDAALCMNLMIHLRGGRAQMQSMLAGLFGMARLTCFNNVVYVQASVVRDAFQAAAGAKPQFAPLDAAARPLSPRGADALDPFLAHGAFFAYRHAF